MNNFAEKYAEQGTRCMRNDCRVKEESLLKLKLNAKNKGCHSRALQI